MAEYTIEYQAKERFDDSIRDSIFELLVYPCNNDTQIVLATNEKNSVNPDPDLSRNFFGFRVKRIRAVDDLQTFSYSLTCKVKKLFEKKNIQSLSVESERSVLNSQDFYIDNHLFLSNTDLTTISKEQKPLIPLMSDNQSVMEFCSCLNKYVHEYLKYSNGSAGEKIPAEKALELKQGSCQDYTHIFLSMARHNKIPARYVSGYLFPAGKAVNGAEKMHSWAEVLIPGKAWVGFDSANNCLVDQNYIKVAHGNDYTDCSPIKGVFLSNGESTTNYSVRVQAQ